jgi:O-antigen/teichoic acid export membrane protein
LSARGSLREHASASAMVAVGTVTLNLAMALFHRQMSERLGAAYGDFSALNGLVNIAVVVASGGGIWLTRLLAHDAALDGEGAALQHLKRLAPRLALVMAAAGVVMGLAAPLLIAFLHLASWQPYALAAGTVMAGLALMTARSLMQGVQRFGTFAASYLLEAAGRATVPALLAGTFGLAGCMAGTTVVPLLAALAVLPLLWRHRDAKPHGKASTAGGGLARDTVAMALFSVLCFLDILLFKHAHGGRDEDLVALYSRAALVGKSFLYVASAFTLVALPAISAAYARGENTRRLLWRFLLAMAAVDGFGLLVFWGATHLLLRTLLGDRPELDALVPVARSLAVAVIPLALFQLVMLYCLATHRQGLVPLMAVATAAYALALWGLGDSPASFIGCMGAMSLFLLLGGLALVVTQPGEARAKGRPGLKATEAQQAGQKAHFDAEYSGYRGYRLENWRLAYIRRIFPELGLKKGVRPAFRFLDVGHRRLRLHRGGSGAPGRHRLGRGPEPLRGGGRRPRRGRSPAQGRPETLPFRGLPG